MGSKANVKNMAKIFESSPPQHGPKSKEVSGHDTNNLKRTVSAVESLGHTVPTPDPASPKPRIRVSSPSETVAALQSKLAFNPAMLKKPTGDAKNRRVGSFSSKTLPLPAANVSRRSMSASSQLHSAEISHDTLQRPKVNENARRRPRSRSKFSSSVSSLSSVTSVSSISLSSNQEQGVCAAKVDKPVISDEDSSGIVAGPLAEKSSSVDVSNGHSDTSVTPSSLQEAAGHVHRFEAVSDVPVESPTVSADSDLVSSVKESTPQKPESEQDGSFETYTGNSDAQNITKMNPSASASKTNTIATLQAELFKSSKLPKRLNGDVSPNSECLKRVNGNSNTSPIPRQQHATAESKPQQFSLQSSEQISTESHASSEASVRVRVSPSSTVAALQAKLSLIPNKGICAAKVEKPVISDDDSNGNVAGPLAEKSSSVDVSNGHSDASVTPSLQEAVGHVHRFEAVSDVPVESPIVSADSDLVPSGKESTPQKPESEQDGSFETYTGNSDAQNITKMNISASVSKTNTIATLQAELFKSSKLPKRLNGVSSPNGECLERVNGNSNTSPIPRQQDAKAESKPSEQITTESNASSVGNLRVRVSPSSTVAALQAKLSFNPDMLSVSSKPPKGCRRSVSSVQQPSQQIQCRRSKSDTNASEATIVHDSLQRPVLNRRRRPSQQRFVSTDISTNNTLSLGDNLKGNSEQAKNTDQNSAVSEKSISKPLSKSLRIRASGLSNTVAALQAKLADTLTKSTSLTQKRSSKSGVCRISDSASSESSAIHGSLQKPIVNTRRPPSLSQFRSVDLSRSLRHRWDSKKKSEEGEVTSKSNVKKSIVATLQSKFSFKSSSPTNHVDDSTESTRKNPFRRANSDVSASVSSRPARKLKRIGRWRRKNASLTTTTTADDLALVEKDQKLAPGFKAPAFAEHIDAAIPASIQEPVIDSISRHSPIGVICEESSASQSNVDVDECPTVGSNRLGECVIDKPVSNVDLSQVNVKMQKQGTALSEESASKCSPSLNHSKLSDVVSALNAKLGSSSDQLKKKPDTTIVQSSEIRDSTSVSSSARQSRRTMSDGYVPKPSFNPKARRRPLTQTKFPLLTTSPGNRHSVDGAEKILENTNDFNAPGPVQVSDKPSHACPERPGEILTTHVQEKDAAKLHLLEANSSPPTSEQTDSESTEKLSEPEGSASANMGVVAQEFLCDSAAERLPSLKLAVSDSETPHSASA